MCLSRVRLDFDVGLLSATSDTAASQFYECLPHGLELVLRPDLFVALDVY